MPSERNLDDIVIAECECLRETRELTFRQLKNKWPRCKLCSQNKPMKIKVRDAIPSVHPTD